MIRWVCLLMTFFSCLSAEESFFYEDTLLNGEECKRCAGKVDIGATYLKVNLVESGKTIDTHHMQGVRGSADYFLWKALLARGTALAAWGDAEFQSYTGGLGVCLPYGKFYFTPSIGVTYSRYKSDVDFPDFQLFDLKQRFESFGPYAGLDIQWCITDSWRLAGGMQYSWSRTRTTIRPIVKAKDHSKGPTWSLLLEKDLNKKWSINIGAAYNRSLNHEKHGIKGQGVKIGLTYWL